LIPLIGLIPKINLFNQLRNILTLEQQVNLLVTWNDYNEISLCYLIDKLRIQKNEKLMEKIMDIIYPALDVFTFSISLCRTGMYDLFKKYFDVFKKEKKFGDNIYYMKIFEIIVSAIDGKNITIITELIDYFNFDIGRDVILNILNICVENDDRNEFIKQANKYNYNTGRYINQLLEKFVTTGNLNVILNLLEHTIPSTDTIQKLIINCFYSRNYNFIKFILDKFNNEFIEMTKNSTHLLNILESICINDDVKSFNDIYKTSYNNLETLFNISIYSDSINILKLLCKNYPQVKNPEIIKKAIHSEITSYEITKYLLFDLKYYETFIKKEDDNLLEYLTKPIKITTINHLRHKMIYEMIVEYLINKISFEKRLNMYMGINFGLNSNISLDEQPFGIVSVDNLFETMIYL